VPGENLTRVEAHERAALITVDSYQVELDVTVGPEVFSAKTTVTFSATAGAATFIDAITARVHSVNLNGVELDVAAVSDGVRIQLDGLAEQNVLIVHSENKYTNTGEGLHRFVDPVDGEVYLYTQFEVPDSRRMFAVFEQPDLKATFQFTVTAPAAWQVTSNQPTPEPTVHDNGSATWAFPATLRVSSYITALVAGPYQVVRSELTSRDGRVIPLGVFCRASLFEYLDADYIFEKTRQGFEFFENAFDYAYPFEKYDQLFVPEFNAGAMENAGCVTFTESYVFRSKVATAVRERRVITILHELAHMWFGDLVTMRWWNDLWLNESFAEYASALAAAEATEWTQAWTTFSVMEKSWAYRQDQLPSTHPIMANIRDLDDVQVNFDGITYAKGGSVLKQLAAWVGQEQFLAGVAQYFKKHQFSNTELPDLMTELEATSGRDLSEWTTLWLETAGVNTLRPVLGVDESGVLTEFAIAQTAPADWPTIRPHRMAIGFYNLRDGALVREHRLEIDVDGARTEVPELVGRPRPDLILINDDDLAYAKIRLDEASLAVAIENLHAITDPLARTLVWGSVWDATRDGETPARAFIDLVLGNIAAETESTTRRTVLAQLHLAASAYTSRATRDAQLERIANTLWALAETAEPGSDAQFQYIKSFATYASSPQNLDRVASLRSGKLTLDGLTIDTDLGWELLVSLAAGGRASTADIDAYLATDQTASGNQMAAQARAALPTFEAKTQAFDSVFVHDDKPNTIVRTTGAGFLWVNDPAILVPFVDRYFSEIARIWKERSYSIAAALVNGYFPAPLHSVELADAARAWLAANPEEPALRRLVIEHLAGVERALQAQECDSRA
jgi:aminopeptidase N